MHGPPWDLTRVDDPARSVMIQGRSRLLVVLDQAAPGLVRRRAVLGPGADRGRSTGLPWILPENACRAPSIAGLPS